MTPLRELLRTETGGAALLLTATAAALLWANADVHSYQSVWGTRLSFRLGGWELAQELREWVNTGLMTFFFFVVGLEARREFDMGELRDRRRLVLPLVAGVGGMLVPIAIFLAINAGRPAAHGWGAAMSTDTAFALGMLTLAASKLPARMRAYLLTVTVVDDLVALAVITVFYSGHVRLTPLLVTLAILAVVLILRVRGERHGIVYALLGIAAWVAMFKSGIEPIVVGLILGLLTYASPAARDGLQRASEMFRLFREQPTAELARTAVDGLASAVSPNERLQLLYHPWTSYVIVPLFALANAGVTISGDTLTRAVTSPITLGILLAYIAGKPVGITGSSWLLTRLTRGRVQVPVGWAAVVGGGAIAGIGFTVSLLIATLAFLGPRLEEAELGILGSALLASSQ